MLPDEIKKSLISHLALSDSSDYNLIATTISGGSINQAFKIKTASGIYFLKYNNAGRYPGMFEKEAAGLKLLKNLNEINVPDVLHYGSSGNFSFLLLKFIVSATERSDFWEDFGIKLAALHRHKAGQFGLDHDNFMGSLYQSNTFHDEWTDFFIEERLEPLVKMAREEGKIGREDVSAFGRLYLRLGEIFPETRPSLVHGDLWSGNYMVTEDGRVCLIDPAIYYGHPEVDIAMSTLFGGFSGKFYDAYTSYNTLEKGWQQRLEYYNLYPLMVHVILFGGGYLGSVQRILQKF
ncbi:MAG: fructosamine kinase family protein [Bacteroidales bacterium]|nr:fructosamine kinase family protein [Bacteroidales bacterium]